MRLCLLLVVLLTACKKEDALTVSAAASLKDALEDAAAQFTSEEHTPVRFNFGGSGALRQQIEHGAPVDVFISASDDVMAMLLQSGRALSETRATLASNQLVLVAPRSSSLITSVEDLRHAKRIAVGDPGSVPAGAYARDALAAQWESLQPKFVFTKDVRQVLAYVAKGDVDAGIVYATDVTSEVRVVSQLATRTPISYPMVIIKDAAPMEHARAFHAFMMGPRGQAVLSKHGFRTAR